MMGDLFCYARFADEIPADLICFAHFQVHFGGEDECIAWQQGERILLAVFDGVGGSRGVDEPQELVAGAC